MPRIARAPVAPQRVVRALVVDRHSALVGASNPSGDDRRLRGSRPYESSLKSRRRELHQAGAEALTANVCIARDVGHGRLSFLLRARAEERAAARTLQ